MNPLLQYKYALDAIVIFVLVAAISFGVHKYNEHQQEIGEARIQALWDKQKAADEKAARDLQTKLQKDKDDAVNQASKNVTAANATAAAATESSRVLDGTLKAILASSSNASVEADRRYITALTEVFGDCKDRYRALGRAAQGHADDSLMYQQAWPTAPAAPTK